LKQKALYMCHCRTNIFKIGNRKLRISFYFLSELDKLSTFRRPWRRSYGEKRKFGKKSILRAAQHVSDIMSRRRL